MKIRSGRHCSGPGRTCALFVLMVAAIGMSKPMPAGASPITSRALVEISDLSGVSISPDGERVAFREERASIETNGHDTSWHVVDLESPRATPVRIAHGGEVLFDTAGFPMPEFPQWSPDSQWLYYRSLTGGEIQVWRASRDGAHAEAVTRDLANVLDFLVHPDGSRLIYKTGAARDAVARAEQAEYESGIRVDETTMGYGNVFRSFPVEGRLVSERHVNWAYVPLLSDTEPAYWSVDLQDMSVDHASLAEIELFRMRTSSASAGYRDEGGIQAVASRDGGHTALLSREGSSSKLRVQRADGTVVACAGCGRFDIKGVAWRSADEIVFTAVDADSAPGFAQSLHAWQVSQNRLRTITASDGLLDGDGRSGNGGTCAVTTVEAFCIVAAASVPPRLERVDLDTGLRTVVFDPNHKLAQDGMAELRIEAIEWYDQAGWRFTGHLYLPRSRKEGERLPLFMNYYRCPGYPRGGYGDEWPLAPLAQSGVAAMCINRAATPRSHTADEDYEIALSGIREVVSMLDARGIVDVSRVAMGGMSFGGEVATWVAGKSELLVAVSVANPSVSDFWYWAQAHKAMWRDNAMRRWKLGAPDETPVRWRQSSAPYFVDGIRAAYLMQMPEVEFRLNVELYQRLLRQGTPVDLFVYPHATHRKYQPRQKLTAYERNLDWFRFWLQGYEDSSAAKTRQYRHWRAMRDRQAPAP